MGERVLRPEATPNPDRMVVASGAWVRKPYDIFHLLPHHALCVVLDTPGGGTARAGGGPARGGRPRRRGDRRAVGVTQAATRRAERNVIMFAVEMSDH